MLDHALDGSSNTHVSPPPLDFSPFYTPPSITISSGDPVEADFTPSMHDQNHQPTSDSGYVTNNANSTFSSSVFRGYDGGPSREFSSMFDLQPEEEWNWNPHQQ